MIRVNWIEPGVLAASSIPLGTDDLQSLHEQGIGAIVTLTEHPLTVQKAITPEVFVTLDLINLHVPIPDGFAPDADTAQQIITFIDAMAAQGRATLVHCHAGIGRTGTILHAYYLAHGHSLQQAQEHIKSRRPACTFIVLSDSQRTFLKDFADASTRI